MDETGMSEPLQSCLVKTHNKSLQRAPNVYARQWSDIGNAPGNIAHNVSSRSTPLSDNVSDSVVLDDFTEEPLRSRVRMIVLMVLNDQGLWFEAHSTLTPALVAPNVFHQYRQTDQRQRS
jgi:hypothetical protein